MAFGLGEAYALTCALCWSTAVILFKQAGNSLTADGLNLTKNVFGVLLLIPTALIVEKLEIPALSSQQWLILIASGYFGIAVADTWYFKALRVLGAGRTAIVGSLYSPFVVMLSVAFLGETLKPWQWLGFGLVLIGVFIVTHQRNLGALERKTLFRGATFGAASIFLTAAGVVVMKPILAEEGFFWIAGLRMLAGVVGMLIYLSFVRRLSGIISDIRTKQHKWITIAVASLFGTYLAILFWLAGFKYADASVASVLNETSSVMIVLLAWVCLKEPLTTKKILGAMFTFFGVLVFIGVLEGT